MTTAGKSLKDISLRGLYEIVGDNGHRERYRDEAKLEIDFRRDEAIEKLAAALRQPPETRDLVQEALIGFERLGSNDAFDNQPFNEPRPVNPNDTELADRIKFARRMHTSISQGLDVNAYNTLTRGVAPAISSPGRRDDPLERIAKAFEKIAETITHELPRVRAAIAMNAR
jgi:hypothetical protein